MRELDYSLLVGHPVPRHSGGCDAGSLYRLASGDQSLPFHSRVDITAVIDSFIARELPDIDHYRPHVGPDDSTWSEVSNVVPFVPISSPRHTTIQKDF